jgi:hypothetical protein
VDDDPSGIATYSQAGAQFRLDMLWTMPLAFPLMSANSIDLRAHRQGDRKGGRMTEYDPDRAAEHHEEIHNHVPSEALRVKALESVRVETGLVDSSAVDAWIELYREKVGPKLGARVVAHAWNDAAYKARLPVNGTAATCRSAYSCTRWTRASAIRVSIPRQSRGL